jgi:hypothetical protein
MNGIGKRAVLQQERISGDERSQRVAHWWVRLGLEMVAPHPGQSQRSSRLSVREATALERSGSATPRKLLTSGDALI